MKIKVSACAGCHPGGGPLEFPRKADGTADFSMNLIEAERRNQDSLDGDFYSRFTPDNKSHFRESGLLEADCMICHSRKYYFNSRYQQITARNYRWAATAGGGFGKVKGKLFTFANPNAKPGSKDFWQGEWNFQQRPLVTYHWDNKKLFTTNGKLRGSVIAKNVASQNCLQCHKGPDAKKSGWVHNKQFDAHTRLDFECTDCHGLVGATKRERLQHQIAKGWHPSGTVRDDLDGKGMKTCEYCHIQGKYKPNRSELPAKAKNPADIHNAKFEDVEFHLEMIACTACHSTQQPAQGGYLIDMSTGSQHWYMASNLQAILWPGDFGKLASQPWEPWITKYDARNGAGERYVAFSPKVVQLFGEKNARGEVRPIRLDFVKNAFLAVKNQITSVHVKRSDGKQIARSTVATDQDIIIMLKQLKRNGFQKVVFVREKIYELKNGKLTSYEDHRTAHVHNFPIHHNVVPISEKKTYGQAGAPAGCADCHSEKATFFTKMLIKNIGGYLQNSYPSPRPPYAIPTFEDLELEEVPESGAEEDE